MAKDRARVAALDLLGAALGGRGGLERALADPAFAGLPLRDRAFARALALGALRWLGPIDRALAARLAKAPPAKVKDLLRLGLAQAWVLRTPPHAAVSATVELAPAPFRGLVNAVLRPLCAAPPPQTP